MAERPKGTNGRDPTNSEDSRPARRERTRSSNAVRPSRTPELEPRSEESSRPRDLESSRPRAESQRAPTNSIRPTARPVRAAADPGRDMPGHKADSTEAVPPGRDGAQADRSVVPADVKARFVQVGNKYHFPDGTRAFTDHGNRLTSPSENTEVIKSLISIAQARGWSDITISGTERFKKEAWFAGRVVGLEVRGYSPTEFEQGRLVRALARTQGAAAEQSQPTLSAPASARPNSDEHPGPGPRALPRAGDSRSDARAEARERERASHVGRLVGHGAAPYLHDPQNAMSYFVRIETPAGEREIWGVDLHRALKESLTRPQIGDEIGVRALRRDAVKVYRQERDDEGRVIGEKPLDAHRNAWAIEKREFFKERAQASRVLRDPNVDRQQAVKQHPELLGTYLQLHAAELAAKTLRDPEDQRRFVAAVRTALADSVARGEPLPPVPLKETAAPRREPRAPGNSQRDVAPVR